MDRRRRRRPTHRLAAVEGDFSGDIVHEDLPEHAGVSAAARREMEETRRSRIADQLGRRAAVDGSFVAVCLWGSVCMILAALLLPARGEPGSGALVAFSGIVAGAVAVAALRRRARLAALGACYRAEGPMRGMSSKEKP